GRRSFGERRCVGPTPVGRDKPGPTLIPSGTGDVPWRHHYTPCGAGFTPAGGVSASDGVPTHRRRPGEPGPTDSFRHRGGAGAFSGGALTPGDETASAPPNNPLRPCPAGSAPPTGSAPRSP